MQEKGRILKGKFFLSHPRFTRLASVAVAKEDINTPPLLSPMISAKAKEDRQ
jgi:hypothetical protein